jgi:sortase A
MSDEGSPRWARIVGGVGKSLIAAGVLILLFVVYQLWGTGLQEASSQSDLKSRFNHELGQSPVLSAPATSVSSTTVPGTTAPLTTAPTTAAPTTAVTPPAFVTDIHPGDPVARLEIPKIGVDKIVVAGTDTADLRKGPGHYPNTPLPGQLGNAAIAGHRTTFGAPFYRINELAAGDEIKVTTLEGVFVYRVTEQLIVAPTDVSVIANTADAELTLTSCHPRFSASERIVIKAKLDEVATGAAALPPTPQDYGHTSKPTATTVGPATTDGDQATVGTTAAPSNTVAAPVVDAFTNGWFSDGDAWPQAILWALALAAVVVATWRLGLAWHKRWIAAAIAVLPFLVVLYFFFENAARLLPPNL